jgi:hypothetical protein
MIFTAYLKSIFISLIFLSLSFSSIGQLKEVQQPTYICSKSNAQKSSSSDKRTPRPAIVSKRIKLNIILPADYTPPVAKKQDIIFPETNAGLMKQRILRNKRKKSKNKGCIARAF